jgi:hypothetical protein
MPEGQPTPDEVRQHLAEHIKEEAEKDPDFWKKHDERIAKERQGRETPSK